MAIIICSHAMCHVVERSSLTAQSQATQAARTERDCESSGDRRGQHAAAFHHLPSCKLTECSRQVVKCHEPAAVSCSVWWRLMGVDVRRVRAPETQVDEEPPRTVKSNQKWQHDTTERPSYNSKELKERICRRVEKGFGLYRPHEGVGDGEICPLLSCKRHRAAFGNRRRCIRAQCLS